MAPSAKKAKIDGAPSIPRGGGKEGDGGDSESESGGGGADTRAKKPPTGASPRGEGSNNTPSKSKKGPVHGVIAGGFGRDIGDYCYESSEYDDYHDYDDYDDYYDEEESPRKAKRAKSNGTNGDGGAASQARAASKSKGGGAAAVAAKGYPSSGDDYYSDYDDEYDDYEEEGGKIFSTSAATAAAASPRRAKKAKSNGTNGDSSVASRARAASKAKGGEASAAAAVAAAEYVSSGDDYDGGYDLFSSRKCAEYDRKSHSNVEDHERTLTARATAAARGASPTPPSPLSPIPKRRGVGAFGGGGAASAATGATTTREQRLALRREHRAAMHRKMPDLEFLLTLDLEESYDNLADGDNDGGVMCYADGEEVAEELAGVAATICRQTGVVVLRCGEKKRPASASASAAKRPSSEKGGRQIKKGAQSSDSAKKAAHSGAGPEYGEESSSSSSAPSSDDDGDSLNTVDFFAEPGHLFSPKLLDELTGRAREIEVEVCRRLDREHPGWKGDESSSKVSSGGKNNNAKKTPVDFRYHEVALRGAGRIDIRYQMDSYPFNHPAVVKNHLIFPIVKDMLNQDANLVYAGLILSFPDSSAQPWHMDGRTLFPELDRDVPPYALNVFVPLDDVTEELGPTELIPGSHSIDRAEVIDEAIVLSLTDGRGGSSMYEMEHVVAPLLQRGDALIYDYRVCHRGTENLSPDRTRPMLYLMYARGWFKEHVNFGTERLFQKQKHVTV